MSTTPTKAWTTTRRQRAVLRALRIWERSGITPTLRQLAASVGLDPTAPGPQAENVVDQQIARALDQLRRMGCVTRRTKHLLEVGDDVLEDERRLLPLVPIPEVLEAALAELEADRVRVSAHIEHYATELAQVRELEARRHRLAGELAAVNQQLAPAATKRSSPDEKRKAM